MYDDTATELTHVLAAVQTGHWQGPTATAYLSGHAPYLTWLEHASADSATTAAQHQTAAAAYGAAVASMPSLEELAANHAVHAVLLATNFFGVNTVPITANEADYTRMWVQAAETMSVYQGTATAAVAATPQLLPAPPIVSPAEATSPESVGDGKWLQELSRLITDLLNNAGNVEELSRIFEEFFQGLGFNPAVAAFLAVVALIAYDVLWYPYYASYALLLLPFFAPALSALSALRLLPLLNGQQIPADQGPDIIAALIGEASVDIPAAAIVAPPAAAGSSAGVGGAASSPGPSTPIIPSADGVAALIPYLVSGWGPPGVKTGPKENMAASNSAAASRRAASPRVVAADARRQRSRRSRGRIRMHGNRYEFLQAGDGAVVAADSDAVPAEGPEAIAAVVASTRAAGFAGHADEIRRVPMLPASWRASEQVEQLTQPMNEGKEK